MRWYVFLFGLVLMASPATAQYIGNIPPGTVLGNNQATARPPAPIPYVSGPDTSGFVSGPTSSAANELASWNNLTGNLLKQGVPAGLTGNQTTGSTADGFQVQFKNQTSTDADALYIWKCTVTICTDPSFKGNFDTSRIITVVPTGSTTELQTSQSIYFINNTGRAGFPNATFPAYVGQNIIGICDADGAGCWAGNSIITDKRGQGPATPRAGMFLAGWEADFHVNSVNTQLAGFITGGTSTAQPASSNGYACLYLDGAAGAGNLVKWNTCFSSQHGSSTTFADVGSAQSSGANVNSQQVNMYFRDAASALQNISYAASPGGIFIGTTGAGISASIILNATGAVFATGDLGGLRINSLAAVGGNGTAVGFGLDVGWTEVRVGNTTGITSLFGTVNFANPATAGTPLASLCLDAANNVIKKTTAGPCL